MKKISIITALFYCSAACSAGLPVKYTYNAIDCTTNTITAYGICLLNNTNAVLDQNEINLGLILQTESSTEGRPVNYTSLEPNRYLIIEMPLNVFDTPSSSGEKYKKFSYSLQKEGHSISTCNFSWVSNTPPYYTPPIFVIDKMDHVLMCHYDRFYE